MPDIDLLEIDVAPEERQAQAAAERGRPADAARRLLRAEREAVLSTLSLRRHGWPFASLAPYALSRRGEPILLLSTLAQHTKNLRADARACLFVQDRSAPEPPDGARIALLGRVAPVPAADVPEARARYLARHPRAESYFAAHDFGLYRLAVEEVRYIGGFGVIGWIPGSDLALDPARDPLAAHAAEACRHMNEDHPEALAAMCRARGVEGDSARMVGIDAFGLDVESWRGARVERLRLEFDAPVDGPDAARRAIVEMVRRARGEVRP